MLTLTRTGTHGRERSHPPKGSRWTLSRRRDKFRPSRDHAAWKTLLAQAGVADARLHAARHTAGTMMVATGTDIATVQEVFGHASVATTRIYVEVAKKLKRDAVDKVAAALVDGSIMALLQPERATAPQDR